jgi:hypothetical protein
MVNPEIYGNRYNRNNVKITGERRAVNNTGLFAIDLISEINKFIGLMILTPFYFPPGGKAGKGVQLTGLFFNWYLFK